jgi:Ring finger domain
MPRPSSSSLRDLGGSESGSSSRNWDPSSSSLRFSMLGISGSLRNLDARNTSLGPADEEIRIPTPGSRLLGGLEETALSVPLESTPMRWAAGSCTICLASYQVGESVAWSSHPECEHCFHTSCIEEWVLRKRPPKNRRRRGATGNDHDDNEGADDDGSVPLCPNCRRPFVAAGPFEGGGRDARAGFPVAHRPSMDDGSVGGGDIANAAATATAHAAAAAACCVDPFEGAGGAGRAAPT